MMAGRIEELEERLGQYEDPVDGKPAENGMQDADGQKKAAGGRKKRDVA